MPLNKSTLLKLARLSTQPVRPGELQPIQRLIVILTAMSWTRKQIAGAIWRTAKAVEYQIDGPIRQKLGRNDPAFFTRLAIAEGWIRPRLY